MSSLRPASAVLEEELLSVRAKLLEVAASLDRIDRAENSVDPTDPRLGQLRAAMETLLHRDGLRAEQIQLIFSRPYEDDWREKFRMTNDE
jgi:hypothetical protein